MQACSSARTISEEAAIADPGMNTPLTPPLSVSPIPPTSTSPTPPHSISGSPTTYLEKENTISYRSGTTSPCLHDCDSTTASDFTITGCFLICQKGCPCLACGRTRARNQNPKRNSNYAVSMC